MECHCSECALDGKTRFHLRSDWTSTANTRLGLGGDTVVLPKSPQRGQAAIEDPYAFAMLWGGFVGAL